MWYSIQIPLGGAFTTLCMVRPGIGCIQDINYQAADFPHADLLSMWLSLSGASYRAPVIFEQIAKMIVCAEG